MDRLINYLSSDAFRELLDFVKSCINAALKWREQELEWARLQGPSSP